MWNWTSSKLYCVYDIGLLVVKCFSHSAAFPVGSIRLMKFPECLGRSPLLHPHPPQSPSVFPCRCRCRTILAEAIDHPTERQLVTSQLSWNGERNGKKIKLGLSYYLCDFFHFDFFLYHNNLHPVCHLFFMISIWNWVFHFCCVLCIVRFIPMT